MTEEFINIPKNYQDVLIVVAKRPQPGLTKTRLVPPLTDLQAASLYECFLLDTLDLMRAVPDVQLVLAYLPEEDETYFRKIAPEFHLLLQTGANLGARLDNALTHFLSAGYERVVIMDSDSPTLPVENLKAAFETLSGAADVVIGPSEDGGYYLIGLKQPAPSLLRCVKMSTPHVTADTLHLANEVGLQVELLPAWYDVDAADSLARLKCELYDGSAAVAAHTYRYLSQSMMSSILENLPAPNHFG
jgi:rSAM/selenodomain-associated transferase 1